MFRKIFNFLLVTLGLSSLNAKAQDVKVFGEQDVKPNITKHITNYSNQLGAEVGFPLTKNVTGSFTTRLGVTYSKEHRKISNNSMNFVGASYKLGKGSLGLNGSWNIIRQPNGTVFNELGVFAPYSIRFKLFGKSCSNVIFPWYVKPLNSNKNVFTLSDRFNVILDKQWTAYVQGFATKTVINGSAPDENSAVIRVGAAYALPNNLFKRIKEKANR